MRFRLASYNIRKAVGLDGRRDPARILEVLNRVGGDVVVLQEADRRLGSRPTALPRFLIEQETDYEVADLARNDVSLGWHGNAVLVRRGIEIADQGHFDLPGLEPRGAVYVRLQGGPVVVGTHLGLIKSWRQKQMKSILSHLNGQVDRAIVAGDFNEWRRVGGFEPWEDRLSLVTPGQSFHAARPVAPLDRFAHGRALTLTGAEVEASSFARHASDHLPVRVEVGFRTPAVPFT